MAARLLVAPGLPAAAASTAPSRLPVSSRFSRSGLAEPLPASQLAALRALILASSLMARSSSAAAPPPSSRLWVGSASKWSDSLSTVGGSLPSRAREQRWKSAAQPRPLRSRQTRS